MSPEHALAPEVWTVGHSDRTAEQVVGLLRSRGITRVIDVRSHPWSRRHPWHGRAEMELWLERAGIGYTWLGGQLGGMLPDGFQAHRASDTYVAGIEELARVARDETVAVLCAEKDPAHCHRRFIADDLARLGFAVRHMIEDGLVAPHQPSLI